MEYGWNRVVTDSDERPSISDEGKPAKDTDTMSMRSTRSWHSRRDVFTLRSASSPFTERVTIHDWKPPQPSTVPSTNDEEAQLEALQKHIESIKAELDKHNVLQAPMLQLVCFFLLSSPVQSVRRTTQTVFSTLHYVFLILRSLLSSMHRVPH